MQEGRRTQWAVRSPTCEGRGDNLDRLAWAVYRRAPQPRDYIGGSNANILHDATERITTLTNALEESVKLQSHYARILNDYDGGQRREFDSAEQWIERLEQTKEKKN